MLFRSSALELLAESDAAGPRHPHLAVARTMSKAFGMAGLRLGYEERRTVEYDILKVSPFVLKNRNGKQDL